MAAEARKMLRIGAEIWNSGIDDTAGASHQTGEAPRPARLARSFENEPQPLLDQILELAAAQCGLRLGPAVEIITDFDCDFHGKTPYLLSREQKSALESRGPDRAACRHETAPSLRMIGGDISQNNDEMLSR